MKVINTYTFGDIKASYILNVAERAVLIIYPADTTPEIMNERNSATYQRASLAHIHLSEHSNGIFSNSFKLSETLDTLKFKEQRVEETTEYTLIVTDEKAPDGYGIRHYLKYIHGEKGLCVQTEFYNNAQRELRLEYLTSVSLDNLGMFIADNESNKLVFHRFKAGWSMEGLLQSDTLTAIGLERAWATAGECIKLGAVGSRPVREYHPYAAVEDTENGISWGVYLAHNASWQMELARATDNISLSIGIADSVTGLWSKRICHGETFTSPVAYVSVTHGGIAELSNRMLSMRHRNIDKVGEKDDMAIAFNDYAMTWGKPSEKKMLAVADILKKGKTKYLVTDAGWYAPAKAVGDWNVDMHTFPSGLKGYCDKVRALGFIPGVWMEFERAAPKASIYNDDEKMITKDGHAVVGHVINGGLGKFFDFSKPEVIEYLDRKIIGQLKEAGVGYLKIDYNASMGAGIDGEDSAGENLRRQMELVREYIKKIKERIPDIVIENCASGGCRLEPSMMDITDMSSASDTHEVVECAVVSANLHYLTPPRQNQIWASLHPEYSAERFTYVISQAFLGRLCWSGDIINLSQAQIEEMFNAENFYEKVCHIIKHGNSYIYRTDKCSFQNPVGTQAVIRYSEDGNEALVVAHAFKAPRELIIELKGNYTVCDRLYSDSTYVRGSTLNIAQKPEFSGNVYYLKRL